MRLIYLAGYLLLICYSGYGAVPGQNQIQHHRYYYIAVSAIFITKINKEHAALAHWSSEKKGGLFDAFATWLPEA